MIFCDRNDWARERHTLHPVINQALEWIAATDFSALEPGKFDILPENKMFCLYQTMETESASARRAESHFNYVDIQYLLSGEETIGVARAHPSHGVVEDRAAQHDIVFYHQTHNESMIALEADTFVVLFPHDVHRPCCQTHGVSRLRKAVIKIHLSLFTDERTS